MSPTSIVVLWLGTSSSYLSLQADLDAWAMRRGYTVVAPQASAHPASTPYPEAVERQLEQLLDRARILADSGAERDALSELHVAARTLDRHPELPQAAWLMAECLQLEAQIHQRYPERAELVLRLFAQARLLEGERAPTFDVAAPPVPLREAGPLREAQVVSTPTLSGVLPNDVLYDNGEPLGENAKLGSGRHHIRVLRGGAQVWAGWIMIEPGVAGLALPVPPPTPCSEQDFGKVTVHNDRVSARPGVFCPKWAVARPSSEGGVDVALCRAAACGPLLPWKRSFGRFYEGPAQPPIHVRSDWVPYAFGAFAAAAGVAVVMWRLGVFDGDPEPRTRWAVQGP